LGRDRHPVRRRRRERISGEEDLDEVAQGREPELCAGGRVPLKSTVHALTNKNADINSISCFLKKKKKP
jgi:hypothetical protein